MAIYKYCVVILNYNTASDCILAVDSIIENASTDNFKICVADNASTKINEIDKIKKINKKNTEILLINENRGYSYGNNAAIKYMEEKYNFEYIVIMNPDVLLTRRGSIEYIIDRIENSGEKIIGGQPLVWTQSCEGQAEFQINIRKVLTYKECVIESFYPLKVLLKKRYEEMIYKNEQPYNKELNFEVPSGAFFIIKSDTFKQVSYFDPNTFLYGEELILGHKIKKLNKSFLLVPDIKVVHEQGKSTGLTKKKINRKTNKYMIQSMDIFLKHYIKSSIMKRGFVFFLASLNFEIKNIIYNLKSEH